MAPPVPVLTQADVHRRFKAQLANPQKYLCHLTSITQHECTFKGIGTGNPRILCLPFKRLFQRCLTKPRSKSGLDEKWINIEVTDATTNQDLMEDARYADDVQDFLAAEKDLKDWVQDE